MLQSSKPRKSDAMPNANPATSTPSDGAAPGIVKEGQGLTAEQLAAPGAAPTFRDGTTTPRGLRTQTALRTPVASTGTDEAVAAHPRTLPKTALGYTLFLVIAGLGALVAWRTMGTTGVGGAARMAGAGGALAAATACMFVVNIGGGRDRSWQTPWIVVAAALLCRVMWEFLGLNAKSGALRPASDALLVPYGLLIAGGVALWTWQWLHQSTLNGEAFNPDRVRRGPQLLWLVDGLLIGVATAVALWWLIAAPALASVAKTSGARPSLMALATLAFDFSALAMALMAWLSMRNSRVSRPQPPAATRFDLALPAATLAMLLFTIIDSRLMGVMRSATVFDLVLRFLAPLGLGITALHEAGRALNFVPANDGSDTASSSAAAKRAGTATLDSEVWISGARQMAIVALPALAILVMTWRLSFLRAAILTTAPGALWWAPALLFALVVRYALAQRSVGQGTINTAGLQQQVAQLKQVVAHRTFQLSTLHTVTAELSDTQGCEPILVTTIERTMAALGARAGGIWLNIDAAELNSDDGPKTIQAGETSSRTVSNATFVWRELERAGTERMSLEGLGGRNGAVPNSISSARSQSTSGGPAVLEKRWSLVLARGDESAQATLRQLHQILESEQGLERFEALNRTDTADAVNSAAYSSPDLLAVSHVAAIRSKGELLGALGVVREGAPLDASERSLVTALALEVAAALQNVQLYQEASRLADRDSLTDLFNHRAIQQQLNAVLSRAQRSETELAVVMMDLNNFKFFNDTYGHPEGDRVLKIVAQCLREACRSSDIIGRFGGDEFITLLVDTDTQGALHGCRRIAARVEEEGYQQRGDARRIPIGLSFGAAIYPHDGTTAMELLTVADANLYEAKRGGAPMMIKRSAVEETQELRKLKDAGTGGSFGVLDALVTAIDNKDHYTRRHSEDVTHWATLIARELDYSAETQRAVRIAGLLHDVGKIAVPDAILRKPGRLNDDEFQIMQQHPVFGALIVKDVPNLPEVLGGIRHHHERFDGKGYPDKLAGEDIPLLGRILAVPDCFSAMTTDRPYRKALSWSEALEEIEKGKGTQFDPTMADAFLEVMARIIMEQQGASQPSDDTRDSYEQDAMQSDAQGVVPQGKSDAASEVARRMADPDAVFNTPDDAQLLPRSVADAGAETKS